MADVEHGAGRLLAAAGQYAGASEPLVQALFVSLLGASRGGRRGALALPLDDVACPPLRPRPQRAAAAPTAAARGSCRSGSPRPGLLTFAYFSIASHVLGRPSAKRIDLLWSVMFVIISVIYRPIEQLLSRTIADRRARGLTASSLRVPMLDPGGFALIFLGVGARLSRRAGQRRLRRPQRALLGPGGGHAGLRGELLRSRLAGRPPVLRASTAALVLMEAISRIAVRARRGHRSRRRAVGGGARHRGGAVRLAGRGPGGVREKQGERRGAGTTHPEHEFAGPITVDEADAALAGPGTEGVQETAAHGELSLRRGGGFAIWVSGIMLAEQTLLNAAVLTVDATSNQSCAGGHRVQRPADRTGAVAALPGDPDLAAAAPGGPRGNGGAGTPSPGRSA